ncbi:Dpy-19/Dpy-19-like protein [Cryptosporidium felis]|nr:Dpy-19/Dpy-19-like protein [Cryptosporidium felis]
MVNDYISENRTFNKPVKEEIDYDLDVYDNEIRNRLIWNKTLKVTILSSVIFTLFLFLRHRKILIKTYYEQKLSLFSETAFYYSYFEDIVNSQDSLFNVILNRLIRDNRTEYPDVINSLSRFNIYQEVILGILYRVLINIIINLKYIYSIIYISVTGNSSILSDLSSKHLIQDSSFILSPFNFYYYSVNTILGIGLGIICGTSTLITDGSYISGFTCMGFLFGNFQLRLLSRISSLPLRENFALPFIWLNNMVIISILKSKHSLNLKKKWFLLFISSLIIFEFWQFSVFVITVQLISIYIIYLLGYEYQYFEPKLKKYIIVNIISLATSYLLHFCDHHILFSPLPLVGISIYFILSLYRIINGPVNAGSFSLLRSFIIGLSSTLLFIAIKIVSSPFSDHDAHVFDMLLTTLLGKEYANFDTMIYKMGGSEFSWITKKQINMIKNSGVLYIFIPNISIIMLKMIINTLKFILVDSQPSDDNHKAEYVQSEDKTSIFSDDDSVKSSNFSVNSTSTSHSPIPNNVPNLNSNSCLEYDFRDNRISDTKESYNADILRSRKTSNGSSHNIYAANSDIVVSFMAIHTIIVCILSISISRLRVISLPYISVISSIFASRNYLKSTSIYFRELTKVIFNHFHLHKTSNLRSPVRPNKRDKSSIIIFLISLFVFSLSISRFPTEELKSGMLPENNASSTKSRLIDWINTNLPDETPILSDMVVSATLRLMTKTKIITHPQYENVKIRKRTQFVYSISACISIKELYDTMEQQFRTDYLLLSIYRCAEPKGGDTITIVHVTNYLDNIKHRCNNQENIFQRTCWRIQLDNQNNYFELIYRNAHYSIYKRRAKQDLEISHIYVNNRYDILRNYSDFPFKRKLLDWQESWEPWITNCRLNDKYCPHNIVDYARMIIDIYNIVEVSALLYEKAISIFPNNSYAVFNYAEFLDYDLGGDPTRIFGNYKKSLDLYKSKISRTSYLESEYIDNNKNIDNINQGFGLKMILGLVLYCDQVYGRTEHIIEESIKIILEDKLVKVLSSNFEISDAYGIVNYLNSQGIIDINYDLCLVNFTYHICMISSYLRSLEVENREILKKQSKYPSWLIKTVYNKLWAIAKLIDPNNACVIKYWNLFHGREKNNIDYIYCFFLG